MGTYREAIYMILDLFKDRSDDSNFNEDHILYLLDKYRAFVLKNKYDSARTADLSESNYQTITLHLEDYYPLEGASELGKYLRSTEKIPVPLNEIPVKVYAGDYFNGEIIFVPRNRFKYVGRNQYLKNIIYVSIGDDGKLYLKSCNPQAYYLEQLKVRGIFESASDASKIASNDVQCDILDMEFPVQEDLFALIMDYIVKELSSANYRPEDIINSAKDDMSGLSVKGDNTK